MLFQDDSYANGSANASVDAVFKKIQKQSTAFLIWRVEVSYCKLTRNITLLGILEHEHRGATQGSVRDILRFRFLFNIFRKPTRTLVRHGRYSKFTCVQLRNNDNTAKKPRLSKTTFRNRQIFSSHAKCAGSLWSITSTSGWAPPPPRTNPALQLTKPWN